jgi:hypothetical protein
MILQGCDLKQGLSVADVAELQRELGLLGHTASAVELEAKVSRPAPWPPSNAFLDA